MGFIMSFFYKWGIFAVFLLVALEYACFPLPSEIILPFTGFLANERGYSLVGVIIFSTVMGYIGCLFCYVVGYYGGGYLYSKLYKKMKKWRKGLDSANYFFEKYGNLSVLGGRILPLCRTYISFFAGMFKQGLFKYSLYSIIGILVWNSFLISMGYYLADKWGLVSKYLEKYKIAFFLVLFILLICFFVYKNKKNAKTINGD